MRRLAVATFAAGLVLALPTAALAQDAVGVEPPAEVGIGDGAAVTREAAAQQPTEPTDTEPDDTGIGEPDSVTCTGTVSAVVVDLDGALVGGSLLTVAGQQVAGSGSVETTCGSVSSSLLAAPEGYAAAGPTDQVAEVRRDQVTTVTFTVDPVEVLGEVIERPAPDAPAAEQPAPSDEGPAPQAADELPETGPGDTPTLLLAALLCGLLGVVLLGATPAPRPARTRG